MADTQRVGTAVLSQDGTAVRVKLSTARRTQAPGYMVATSLARKVAPAGSTMGEARVIEQGHNGERWMLWLVPIISVRFYVRYGPLQLPAGAFYPTREDAQAVADATPAHLGPAIVCETEV